MTRGVHSDGQHPSEAIAFKGVGNEDAQGNPGMPEAATIACFGLDLRMYWDELVGIDGWLREPRAWQRTARGGNR